MHARFIADDSMRSRFVREATVSAQMESDQVVEVRGAAPTVGPAQRTSTTTVRSTTPARTVSTSVPRDRPSR